MRILRRGGVSAFCSALILGAAGAGPALAHHSFSMFDSEHQAKMVGTVKEFNWTNPHVYILLQSADAGGAMKDFTVECANPGILNRVGWKFNMIKPGDKLTVIIAPLRSGEAGGLLKEVTLPDGRVMGNGAPAGQATIH